jgi:glutamate/tyrosine decarboxylase-like PLP-dependent enzyme
VGFDLDATQRRDLGYKLIDRLDGYFADLADRPVQPPLAARTRAGERTAPLPETGEDASAVLDELFEELIDNGFHTPSGNYLGLQNPTPTYVGVLADAAVSALNPQLASLVHSNLAARIERQTLRWIGERIGWNGPFDGTFTSGGSEANLTGIALALAHHFPASIHDGVAALPARPVLYCTAERHHSIDKATSILGLGRKALRHIPVTDRIQLDVGVLEEQIRRDKAAGLAPFCVVATAGTTSSGHIDDIPAIADVCARHGLWLHVDGAYGVAAIFSEKHRHLLRGIERADSVSMDPHKWLAMPMSVGVVMTSHPETLMHAFAVDTPPFMPALQGPSAVDNFDVSTQWSRRMNSLKLWLTLRVHGRRAYEELIDRQIALATGMAAWIERSDGFELAAPQVLPSIIFRVRMPGASDAEIQAANKAVVDEITRDGKQWISHSMVAGRPVIRMLIISYLTEQRHLDELQAALTAALARQRPPELLSAAGAPKERN